MGEGETEQTDRQTHTQTHTHTTGFLASLLTKAIIPLFGLHTHDLLTLRRSFPKAPSPDTLTLGLGGQHMNFG